MLARLRRNQLSFDYQVRYSNRRTVGIYISGAAVEVRAPHGADDQWIERFVQEKANWIASKLEMQREKAAECFRLEDQSEITVLGEHYQIRIVQGGRNSVDCTSGYLTFTLKGASAPTSPATLESLFRRWMLNLAQDYMVPKTHETADALGVAHRLKEIRFRRTKTKWGHCSSRGTIQYNWLIMLAPKEVVDYLIVHEACHLVHLNHSANYWALVGRVCPEYRARRQWLKENEHRYRVVGG